MDKTNKNPLLEAGMSHNRIKVYLGAMQAENTSCLYEPAYRAWAHSEGFLARNACYYGLTAENIGDYLSDYDYNLIWPLNNWTRLWINDKLTLKLILEGTAFSALMPEYYYYTTPQGLHCLSDCHAGNRDEDFLQTLREQRTFACKPNNGAAAQGFHKLSCEGNRYFLDDEEVEKAAVCRFVAEHPNYVYTEFLTPSPFFARFSPLIHTIRVNTLNIHGDDPIIIGEWVRTPTLQSKVTNNATLETHEKYNLITKIDTESGALRESVRAYADRHEAVEVHPDTGVALQGEIPNHDQLVKLVLGICRKLNTVEWMGFDICVTKKGFKLMEINSHPGIMYDQIFVPWLSHPILGPYFRQKIGAVNALSATEKCRRTEIQR